MPEIFWLRRTAGPRQDDAVRETRWNARPLIALGVRLVMAGVPAAAAIAVAVFLERISVPPTTWPARIVTWTLLLGVSTIVALVVERRMRSLLPLALLLRMTLVFPDEAPSRYAVARAANSPAKIKELAAAGGSPRAQAAAQVLALVTRLAKHDRYTRGHSERVRVFTDLIAAQMGVSGADRDKLAWGALLHDIGKMTVPGELLNKPGKPTLQEWEVLKGHPLAGEEFAGPLAEWLGPWIGGITEHHERYDGKGYPHGVAAQDISLAGRIVAVADAYETMTAARSYKKPMSVPAARQELTDCAGAHFDPVVVRAFLAVSLPRLMWGVGPLSFLAHLPFVARAEVVSVQLAAASSAAAPAAAAAAVGAVSVVTAGAVAPAPAAPAPQPVQLAVADSTTNSGNSVASSGQLTSSDTGTSVSPTGLSTPGATSRLIRTSKSLQSRSATGTATTEASSSDDSLPSPSSESTKNEPATGPGASNGEGNASNSGKANGSSGQAKGGAPSTGNSGNGNSGSNNGKGNGSSTNGSSINGNSGKGSGSGAISTLPAPSSSQSTTSTSSGSSSNSGNGNSGKTSSGKAVGKNSATAPAAASS